MKDRKRTIDKVFQRVTKSRYIHECVLLVEDGKGDFFYSKGYNEKSINTPIIMASITKLFTTTCIIILHEQGKLSLEDKISKYFEKSFLRGLNTSNGKEYAFELTIHDLLCQTSGFADSYTETKGQGGVKSVIKEDQYITFQQVLESTKLLNPAFRPNAKGKAHYSDLNFDLLGEIIEKVTDMQLAKVYELFICKPLHLSKTYLPTQENQYIPDIYYKEQKLSRPLVIRSSRASGGCISTTKELMVFLKAFFGHKLFRTDLIEFTKTYNKIQKSMGPIEYGCGHMRIELGGLRTCFMGHGGAYGHFGSTGSFAFYYPEKDLYFTGDINQIASISSAFRFVMQLAMLS